MRKYCRLEEICVGPTFDVWISLRKLKKKDDHLVIATSHFILCSSYPAATVTKAPRVHVSWLYLPARYKSDLRGKVCK